MTDTERYNGWANWATWNVVLWARNEEATYNWWVATAKRLKDDRGALTTELMTHLQARFMSPDMEPEDYKDVDWDEVVDAALEDVA